jgi:hypothetical protein
MSTENEEQRIAPREETCEEKLIAQLKSVRLTDVGKGKLTLTDRRIEFEARKGLFSPPQLEFSVDLSAISTATVDDSSSTLVLEWLGNDSEYAAARLQLPRGGDAAGLCTALRNMLDLMILDAEEQRKRALYQDFLWRTAYRVWIAVDLTLQMVRNLMNEDWDAVDGLMSSIQETSNALMVEKTVDIAGPIRELIGSIPSRDTVPVFRNALDVLRATGASLNNDLAPAEEWGELALEESSDLNWRDIRYVFLFAIRYGLLSLWRHAGEAEKVQECGAGLAKYVTVIEQEILANGFGGGDLSKDAEEAMVDGAVELCACRLEDALKTKAGIA